MSETKPTAAREANHEADTPKKATEADAVGCPGVNTPKLKWVDVRVPVIVGAPDGYAQRTVDTRLTENQADALRLVTAGLMRLGTKTKTGHIKEIDRPDQAVAWLLDAIAKRVPDDRRK